jgi:hypothetical protein
LVVLIVVSIILVIAFFVGLLKSLSRLDWQLYRLGRLGSGGVSLLAKAED